MGNSSVKQVNLHISHLFWHAVRLSKAAKLLFKCTFCLGSGSMLVHKWAWFLRSRSIASASRLRLPASENVCSTEGKSIHMYTLEAWGLSILAFLTWLVEQCRLKAAQHASLASLFDKLWKACSARSSTCDLVDLAMVALEKQCVMCEAVAAHEGTR
eukprot:1275372-Amphidinium_carterae.1